MRFCVFKRVQSKTKIGLLPNWCTVTIVGLNFDWGEGGGWGGSLIRIHFDRIFKFKQLSHCRGMSQQIISGGIMRTVARPKVDKIEETKSKSDKSLQNWFDKDNQLASYMFTRLIWLGF